MKRYWTCHSTVEITPGWNTTVSTPIDFHKPAFEAVTVSTITGWIDEMYPDLIPQSPYDAGAVLTDAVRCLDLYGYLKVWLKDSAGVHHTVEFMQI